MLFRVFYGFEYKILCDVESEKKVGGMWKEVRIYLQRECCQGSEVWSILVRGDRSSGGGGRGPVLLLVP